MMLSRSALLSGLFLFLSLALAAQPAANVPIPAIYSTIKQENGRLFLQFRDTTRFWEIPAAADYTLQQVAGNPQGTKTGLSFDFGPKFHKGTLYYGFIPYGDSKYPHPVYFRAPSVIDSGRAQINIARNLSGIYDMVGWQKSGHGTLGYRLVDSMGQMFYDGIIRFRAADSFAIAPTITEGPFVNKLGSEGATISFTTNGEYTARVLIDGRPFADAGPTRLHEIDITGLKPDTLYAYSVVIDDTLCTFSLHTAPRPGARRAFTFAYASDSRSGQGGGERDVYGANFYIMKKILALVAAREGRFLQFTGDLINGYLTSPEETELQYANWKRSVQPFWHHLPIYAAMGNHEALVRAFNIGPGRLPLSVDRFPFDTESAEAIFARQFVNPTNGPLSEDGAAYDPDSTRVDFPSYQENVFYYTYDNVAVVVLNSDYLYAPNAYEARTTNGNIHGYLMDQQLAWIAKTLQELEQDAGIDHIFLTQHTPCFPNGGHVRDDMWYSGNNQIRPYIAGRPMPKGIIERRDQYLDLAVNNSTKVRAILTGDEHNYNRLHLTPETKIYPETYFFPKIELKRSIYQINNGAAGAPYYAQEQTPWTPFVSGFTTQNAVVFFHVHGKKIEVEVVNPDTLEEVDRFTLADGQ